MSTFLSPDIIKYGIPLSAIVPFLGLIMKFVDASKKAKIIGILLVFACTISGIGLNAFNIKIALPTIPQTMSLAFSLLGASLESIYVSISFLSLVSIVCSIFYLLFTGKLATSILSVFSMFLCSMPLVILFVLLGLSPLLTVIISSSITIIFTITLSSLLVKYNKNQHKIMSVISVYGTAMLAIDVVILLVFLIGNNFASFFTSHLWKLSLHRNSVEVVERCIHQFTFALLTTLLLTLAYVIINHKSIDFKKKGTLYQQIIQTYCTLVLRIGVVGSLLMLIPLEAYSYAVTSIIACSLAIIFNVTLECFVVVELRKMNKELMVLQGTDDTPVPTKSRTITSQNRL